MLQAKGEDQQTRVAENHFQKAIAEKVRLLKFIQLLEPMIADARQLVVSFSSELSQIGRLDMVHQLWHQGFTGTKTETYHVEFSGVVRIVANLLHEFCDNIKPHGIDTEVDVKMFDIIRGGPPVMQMVRNIVGIWYDGCFAVLRTS
jgi:hypothetical protein